MHPQATQQWRERRTLLVGREKTVADIAGDDELRADRQQPLQVGDPARRGVHGGSFVINQEPAAGEFDLN